MKNISIIFLIILVITGCNKTDNKNDQTGAVETNNRQNEIHKDEPIPYPGEDIIIQEEYKQSGYAFISRETGVSLLLMGTLEYDFSMKSCFDENENKFILFCCCF